MSEITDESIKGKTFFTLTTEERKYVMDKYPPTISALHSAGAYFDWSWTGCGFGQLGFSLDHDGKQLMLSNENMSRDSVRIILHSLADYIADRAILADNLNDLPIVDLVKEVEDRDKRVEKLVRPSTSAISEKQSVGRVGRVVRNNPVVTIKYSSEQLDALTDSQIYNQPYGLELGEEKYILNEVKKLGYNKVINISMDDIHFIHRVEVE